MLFQISLGRKISLGEIRKKMLQEQEQYMRLFPDDFYENISIEVLRKEFERIDEQFNSSKTKNELADQLKLFHRRRHLSCWHDGSSISNHGHLLVTFITTYDKAIFYTDDEYFEKTGWYFKIRKSPYDEIN